MYEPFGMHSMNWSGHWMSSWWIIMMIALFVGAILFFFRQNNSVHKKSALDILKERYARGEITKIEFEEKKNDLFK
jgi:putative membrane protein